MGWLGDAPWGWVVVGVVVLAAFGVLLSWTAGRLDRLHARVDSARASLDAQLFHRSGAALEVATGSVLDPAAALLLLDAAHQARAAQGPEREAAESDLSRALRAVFDDPGQTEALRADPDAAVLLDELGTACRRVELARRFHNDVVVSARALHDRRLVRWLHLSGHAPMPVTSDFDDRPPQPLAAG